MSQRNCTQTFESELYNLSPYPIPYFPFPEIKVRGGHKAEFLEGHCSSEIHNYLVTLLFGHGLWQETSQKLGRKNLRGM